MSNSIETKRLLSYTQAIGIKMKHSIFRKEGLEFLKKRYKKTTDDFIKDTYPKKEQATMRVKISRLINKPKDAPGYFGIVELATDLSTYFNKFRINGDPHIALNFFLGNSAYVDIIGESFGNGQIKLFERKNIKKCSIPIRYLGCEGIISRIPAVNGMIRIFKPINIININCDNRLGFCQDLKSKIIYLGVIEPKSNGNYDILDVSISTGKTIKFLAEDIKLKWSTRILSTVYPSYWDY